MLRDDVGMMDNGSHERANIESLLDAQVDGLIVNTVGGNDEWLSSYCLEETHKPVVLLDRIIHPTVCDGVQTANVQAVSEMMAHLESRGFDAVVFVTRPTEGSARVPPVVRLLNRSLRPGGSMVRSRCMRRSTSCVR